MRQPHVIRKSPVRLLVRQIMRDVREKGAARLELFHQAQRIRDRGMRGMRAMTERVKKQDVQPAQLLLRFRRNLAEVGEVCGGAEAETVNLRVAVDDLHRLKTHAEQLQRAIDS